MEERQRQSLELQRQLAEGQAAEANEQGAAQELAAEVEKMVAQRTARDREIADLQNAVGQERQREAALAEQLAALHASRASAEARAAEQQSELQRARASAEEQDAVVRGLEEELSRLRAQADASRSKTTQLASAKAGVESILKDAETTSANAQRAVEELEAAAAERKAEAESGRRRVEELKAAEAAEEAGLRGQREELARLEAAAAARGRRAAQAAEDVERARRERDIAERASAELQKELDSLLNEKQAVQAKVKINAHCSDTLIDMSINFLKDGVWLIWCNGQLCSRPSHQRTWSSFGLSGRRWPGARASGVGNWSGCELMLRRLNNEKRTKRSSLKSSVIIRGRSRTCKSSECRSIIAIAVDHSLRKLRLLQLTHSLAGVGTNANADERGREKTKRARCSNRSPSKA